MKGKISVIGLGPGNMEHMSIKALESIKSAGIIIGYSTYTDLIKDLVPDKEIISSGMRKEIERCKKALELAESGNHVALISSGDSGIYGMAGIMLEISEQAEKTGIEIEVIPGITSSIAAASILGAPVMHDHATISLSDLLTDWELIKKRIEYAAKGDFVICIYNPRSRKRVKHIEEARNIILKHRDSNTPVGIVRNAMREDQTKIITTLKNMLNHEIDMKTVIIIGNSMTYISGKRMITPRGYNI